MTMKRRYVILIAAVALFLGMLTLTWSLCTRRAKRQTESMLDYAILDLRDTLNGSIDTMLMQIGESIIDELGKAEPISVEYAQRIIARHHIDELNVLDRTGRNLGSSDGHLVGTSMKDSPKSGAFMVLAEGERHAFSQPFRAGVHNPNVRRKYVGVAFPDGNGFIQVGIDELHVTRMFPSIMGFIFDEWLLGETGFFLCADVRLGRLISNPARHRDEARFLAETGYDHNDPMVIEDGTTTFSRRLFGEVCDCRAIIFAGHRIIAALPPAEFYHTRTLYTVVMAFVLAVVLSSFVMLLWRIDKDAIQIRAFYAAEESKRAAELELGRTIQSASLPTEFPKSENYRIAASMLPAREVGGDFYDFFQLDDTHIAFLVADVSGKGITGALYMMTAKTLIKDMLLETTTFMPADALVRVNEELCRNNPAEMFITAWVGVLDLDTGIVAFANAGHNPPLIRHADGEREWIKARSGCPLACFENAVYKQLEVRLAPGDLLFLYTDGITEAMNGSGELYGNDRLFERLGGLDADGAGDVSAAVCAGVRASVGEFAADALQADDLTVLAMQYLCPPERYVRTFPAKDAAFEEAASFVEEKLQTVSCPNKTKGQVLIALDEVLSNVVRCSGASGIAVSLTFSQARHTLTMAISDDGKPFNPLQVPPPDTTLPPEKRSPGGLGILLLHKTMDEVTYHYAHGCNVLTLRKSLMATS